MPSGVYPGNKGKKLTQATKDKMAAARRGKEPSEETRMKMSVTSRETWRRKIEGGYVSPLKGRKLSKR